MRHNSTARRIIGAALFVLLLSIPLFIFAAEQKVTCSIRDIDGDVVIQRDESQEWQAASQGDQLESGDIIQTRGNSKASLLFLDGSIVRLRENSVLRIKTLTQDTDSGSSKSAFKMLFGKVWAKVKALRSEESLFEIETPTSVAAVKGTIYIVEYQNGRTRIYLVNREDGAGLYVRSLEKNEAVDLESNGETVVVSPDGQIGEVEEFNPQQLQRLEWFFGVGDQGVIEEDAGFFLGLDAPPDSFMTNTRDVIVSGRTTPSATVRVNDEPVDVEDNGNFTTVLNYTDGAHTIRVVAEDTSGVEIRKTNNIMVNAIKPELTFVDDLTRPPFTNDTNYSLTLNIVDATPLDRHILRIDENGQPGEWFEVVGNVYTYFPNLNEGPNTIEVFCMDQAGHDAYLSIERFRDTLAPIVQLTRPASPETVIPRVPPPPPGQALPNFVVEGYVTDPGDCANPSEGGSCPVEVQVNGIDVPQMDDNGFFRAEIPRVEGRVFPINVVATDFLGNQTQVTYTVYIGQ